ncbi:MAG: hypothetical protein HC810_06350 [Acaryochloridaceae cyanobacterium RL_2_7]|nr:hypothetical protein [Acaryochloridaceae cyanobacterium RL_2_7]
MQNSPLFLRQFQVLHPNIRDTAIRNRPEEETCQTVRQDQWRTLTSGMMTLPMELLDHISSPFQIEPRFPLMDKRLVEFCLALPPEQKLRQGWTRLILRKSMDQRLPTSIQWRESKTNFTQAFNENLMTHNLDLLTHIFENSSDELSPWVDWDIIQQMLQPGFNAETITDLWPVITLFPMGSAEKKEHSVNPDKNFSQGKNSFRRHHGEH